MSPQPSQSGDPSDPQPYPVVSPVGSPKRKRDGNDEDALDEDDVPEHKSLFVGSVDQSLDYSGLVGARDLDWYNKTEYPNEKVLEAKATHQNKVEFCQQNIQNPSISQPTPNNLRDRFMN